MPLLPLIYLIPPTPVIRPILLPPLLGFFGRGVFGLGIKLAFESSEVIMLIDTNLNP